MAEERPEMPRASSQFVAPLSGSIRSVHLTRHMVPRSWVLHP